MPQEEGKILIVDDNYENLQVLGMHLQAEGYEIEFSTSGKAALDWLETETFDLVLLDINMPGMDGFEVCGKIRENKSLNNLPVIFLSAENQRDSILKGLSIGGQDYVTKPFDSRELAARVKTHISLKRSIVALETLNHTLEKKVEERTLELKIAKERAEESDRMKHAFLSNFSHEVRTPLAGIVSSADLLISENLDDGEKCFCLKSIEESSARLIETISSVLEMSQLLSGSINARFDKINLVQLVKSVYDEFIDQFNAKNLPFNIEIDESVDEIITDQNILKKILVKLVDNALKFTDNGHVSIGIKQLAEHFEIFVSDTGIGMDDKTLKNVFDPFYQLDQSSKRINEGVGLGLTIAQNFCELLNGKLNITSAPNKGTRIGITLPVQQPK